MSSKQVHKCYICNTTFEKKDHLKHHEDSFHKDTHFDCQECGKQFCQRTVASSETDVAGFAQLQSFQSILLQEDSRMECKGAPPRVNLSKDCVHHQRLM